MELEELKRLHDKAYSTGQTTRDRSADDLVFYWVTQWDDALLADSQLAYRGEFNIVRKAGRQIISDIKSNPVQVDFFPVDENREDAAEVLDGMYRADSNNNTSIEAYDNGSTESIVCGVGAWKLCAEYQTSRAGDERQVVRRHPIYEANNTCFWDPNAKRLDKSDADYCSVLVAYSEDGYKKLAEELTGEEYGTVSPSNFKHPNDSLYFPWLAGKGKVVYVTEFYHREKVKDKAIKVVDPFGMVSILRESDIVEAMDDMADAGFSIEDERVIERWQVTKYTASGERILSADVIAGEHIPIVPVYGERAIVEGEEHYEGVTRLAKDPQRLRNFQLSYLADIASRSPRQKPIFLPEQVQGFESMYSESGADNNYPYLLQNRVDGNGAPLPIGPIAVMPDQNVPSALVASIGLSREAVEDVANPGVPQDIADPDLSGKAVLALQNRMDMQSMVYQENLKHAKRRDGEIYASIAAEIYDTPRKVTITRPDGRREQVEIMQSVVDAETGDMVTLNDLNNAEFEVYSDIQASFSSRKEQTLDRIATMLGSMDPNDPIASMLRLKYLNMMEGVNFDDVREYANKQLVLGGFKEPETDEEKKIAEQAQQNKQPDANTLIAMAENKKADAEMATAQIKQMNMQLTAQNEDMKRQIDMFKAQTDRMNTQVDAQEAGAEINYKNIKSFGEQIENQVKMKEAMTPDMMSDDDLLAAIM